VNPLPSSKGSEKNASTPIFILAGGFGTRFSEETQYKPKPLIEIGGYPILIHIMRGYYAHGFNDFVICGGYKVSEIKKYFLNYSYWQNNLDIDYRDYPDNPVKYFGFNPELERWRVRILDTGLNALTGARVARAFDQIKSAQPIEHFGLTYGDGVTNADLSAEYDYHRHHGSLGTVLGVKNLARYGELDITKEQRVSDFLEKPESRQGYVNGGFFFFNKNFRKYLTDKNDLALEQGPLSKLARDGELRVYRHDGFWQSMDTLRDKNYLESLWEKQTAPWVQAPSLHPNHGVKLAANG
jgi:glucose-1-phosphate cytidylyltransferase